MYIIFPIIITLVAVYIISRETTDDTLKSILTVPISYKKLLIAKFWLLLFLTIVFSIFNALLSICFNAFLGFSGMDIHMMLMSAAQIIVSDILVYISVLPIIIVCAFAEGKSLLGVANLKKRVDELIYGMCHLVKHGGKCAAADCRGMDQREQVWRN